MTAFDFKKESGYPYSLKGESTIVRAAYPTMTDGMDDADIAESCRQTTLETLCSLSYTLKMSKKGPAPPEGRFLDYALPPLEGFFWQFDGTQNLYPTAGL